MRRTKVAIPGNVTYVYRDFFGGPVGGVVGQPPWNDDSDGSYVDLYQSAHPDAAISDLSYGFVQATDLGTLPSDWTKVQVFVSVRVRSLTTTGHEQPMAAHLRSSPANVVSSGIAATAPGASFERVEIPMPVTSHANYSAIVSRIADGTLRVDVLPDPEQPASGSFVYPGVRVAEAHVLIKLPGGVAPPGRLFPRSDGLGVGGGRIFPPPVSQQRSGRRFGYY